MKISYTKAGVPTQTRDATCLWLTLRDDNIFYTKSLQFSCSRNPCGASADDQAICTVHVTLRECTSRLKSLTCCDRDSSLPRVAQNCMQRSLTIKPLATSLYGASSPSQG